MQGCAVRITNMSLLRLQHFLQQLADLTEGQCAARASNPCYPCSALYLQERIMTFARLTGLIHQW